MSFDLSTNAEELTLLEQSAGGESVGTWVRDLALSAARQDKRKIKMIIISSALGFPSTTVSFNEIPFPADLSGAKSYVGHPATKALLEALGASTVAGRWAGPAIGESYIAVPLAQNAREGGWTQDTAISSIAELKCILCTRIS